MDGKVYMNNFREAVSQIQARCEGSEYYENIKKLRTKFEGNPLVLYGAGKFGERTAEWLLRNDIQVDCFCDRSKKEMNLKLSLPIISPQILPEGYGNANVIICSLAHANEIYRDLKKLGFSQKHIFFINDISVHGMMIEDLKVHIDGYEWAYNFFTDDVSKNIILNRIAGYLLSIPMEKNITSEYFDEEVMTLGNSEIFVDGGMFTGDTAMEFFRCVASQFEHYYGFEIDAANYQKARWNLRNIKNTTLLQKGLWSYNTELRFEAKLLESSKLSKNGDCVVSVTSLDAFFRDLSNIPTLIKLDIEGAEMEALLGAKGIIEKSKPKLAICAYHKPEDIYELPKLLTGFNNEYRFVLRHYSDTLFDTVLYAV